MFLFANATDPIRPCLDLKHLTSYKVLQILYENIIVEKRNCTTTFRSEGYVGVDSGMQKKQVGNLLTISSY